MSKRKKRHVSGSKTQYHQKIDELDKEISELEEQCEQQERFLAQRFSNNTLDDAVKKLSLSGSPTLRRNSKSKSNTEEELKSLLTIKGKLEILTGFVFEDDKVLLLESSTDDTNNVTTKRWRRVLSGKCLDLRFEVDFITDEQIQDGEEQGQLRSVAKVSKLNVRIKDSVARAEMETFLVNAEQANSLGTVLQVLSQYARCHSCRQKTFQHFNTKYPEYICFINGPACSSFMEIRNEQRNGLHFTLSWEVHIDRFGNVVPQIDAFVFSSVEVEGADDVIKSTPEQFRKILSQCGIEQAVELLISIVKE